MKLCIIFFVIIFLCDINSHAQNNSYSSQANKFLSSLTANQKKKALYDFKSDERYNWHFVPKNDRKGILLSDINDQQKQQAFGLLKLYLSDTAFTQTQAIIQL